MSPLMKLNNKNSIQNIKIYQNLIKSSKKYNKNKIKTVTISIQSQLKVHAIQEFKSQPNMNFFDRSE